VGNEPGVRPASRVNVDVVVPEPALQGRAHRINVRSVFIEGTRFEFELGCAATTISQSNASRVRLPLNAAARLKGVLIVRCRWPAVVARRPSRPRYMLTIRILGAIGAPAVGPRTYTFHVKRAHVRRSPGRWAALRREWMLRRSCGDMVHLGVRNVVHGRTGTASSALGWCTRHDCVLLMNLTDPSVSFR